VRFAGTEPFDRVTRFYNETMSALLPQYGIEFRELPRLEVGGAPVSASRVRKVLANPKLLEEGRVEEITPLVPESTYEYLRTRCPAARGG
jgi:[citrate (pro-3S)-lyase] ligase